MRPILIALLALAVLPAHAAEAENGAVQEAYRVIERRMQAEYEFHLRGVARQVLASGSPASKIEFFQRRLKLLTYNRAVLVAYCLAETESDRPSTAQPVPPQRNLVLTTCIETEVGRLQKFQQLAAYADFFFPERIEECGEQSRMPEREAALQPYAFLLLDQPKVYDFARYNECMMKPQPGG